MMHASCTTLALLPSPQLLSSVFWQPLDHPQPQFPLLKAEKDSLFGGGSLESDTSDNSNPGYILGTARVLPVFSGMFSPEWT